MRLKLTYHRAIAEYLGDRRTVPSVCAKKCRLPLAVELFRDFVLAQARQAILKDGSNDVGASLHNFIFRSVSREFQPRRTPCSERFLRGMLSLVGPGCTDALALDS